MPVEDVADEDEAEEDDVGTATLTLVVVAIGAAAAENVPLIAFVLFDALIAEDAVAPIAKLPVLMPNAT